MLSQRPTTPRLARYRIAKGQYFPDVSAEKLLAHAKCVCMRSSSDLRSVLDDCRTAHWDC